MDGKEMLLATAVKLISRRGLNYTTLKRRMFATFQGNGIQGW